MEADPLASRLQALAVDHTLDDTVTPNIESPASPAGHESAELGVHGVDSSSNDTAADGFIFGAATRLGGRILTTETDVWSANAWDNVQWDEEQERAAQEAVERQKQLPIPPEQQDVLNRDPQKHWDRFYANVADNFFKDRSWPCLEFKDLAQAVQPDAGPVHVCEIGCGTGATAYPLMALNNNPELFIHCLDYSKKAIELVKKNPAYDERKIKAEVWSICNPNGLSDAVRPGSVDIVTLIFVLSALHPSEWKMAIKNVWTMLKPGGKVLFRDYGRNDLTQLRFKGNRFMQEGLYARGDKTRVYFFTKDELKDLFCPSIPPKPAASSLSKNDVASDATREQERGEEGENSAPAAEQQPNFAVQRIGVDRRLLMNRKRRLKMYRVWLQGEFAKPALSTENS